MDTANILKAMKGIPLFLGVSPERLQKLAMLSRCKTYRTGEIIVGETDPVRAFHVVLTGQVKLYKSSSEGKEQTLYLLGPGEPFGLCTAFAIESFPANVSALEESVLIIIPGPDVERAGREEPVFLLNVIQILSRRLKESMTLVESLALQEIPQRLAAFLLHSLHLKDKTMQQSVHLTTTHRELAKIIGATPEALSRALKKMTGDGLVAVNGRIISVLNRSALEEMAEGE